MVAQCASLVHRVAIAGWELMQFPWVRAISGKLSYNWKPDIKICMQDLQESFC